MFLLTLHNHRRRHRNKGFTLIELLVVIALITTLISSGIYFVDISQKRKSIDLFSVQLSALRNFPTAILQVYQTKLTLVGLTVADLTDTEEVTENKPTAWAISGTPTKNSAAIVFTLESGDQASDLLQFLSANQDAALVSQATVDGNNDTKIIVTYAI